MAGPSRDMAIVICQMRPRCICSLLSRIRHRAAGKGANDLGSSTRRLAEASFSCMPRSKGAVAQDRGRGVRQASLQWRAGQLPYHWITKGPANLQVVQLPGTSYGASQRGAGRWPAWRHQKPRIITVLTLSREHNMSKPPATVRYLQADSASLSANMYERRR